MNRLGREHGRLEPSHSCTQNDVIIAPSTDRITQTLPTQFYGYFDYYKSREKSKEGFDLQPKLPIKSEIWMTNLKHIQNNLQ